MSRIAGVSRILIGLLLAGVAAGPSSAGAVTRAEFDAFADRYLAAYYEFRPVQATRDGVHLHDGTLGRHARDQVDAEVARLKTALAALREMKPATLDSARRVDYEILLGNAQGRILDLTVIRGWQTDPGYYLDLITEGVHSLTARSFATVADRLKNVISRENATGAVLAAALENLANPPRLRTEAAIERTGGAIVWFRDSLPRVFESVADPVLKAEFEKSNAQTIQELEGYRRYLKEDLLPFSRGDFRLGPEALQNQLQYDELCDVPLLRLEWTGDEEVKRLQTDVKATAAALDLHKTPEELYHIYAMDHPRSERLVSEAASLLDDLRRFCVTNGFVGLPPGEDCRVVPMPEFRRGTLAAALDPPGPLETKGREAWFTLALPDTTWDEATQDQYLSTFNRYELPVFSMQETWPGALVQALWDQKGSSRVRRALGCRSLAGGWRLYATQVMLEQGYSGSDARYRLFQLRRMLAATCRYLVALRIHGGQMTLDQAVDFLMKQACLERVSAEREARQAALDPGCLTDELGKLEILKLREDLKRVQGSAFTLRRFNDRLLENGAPPVKLLRRMFLPGDKAPLL